MAYNFRSNVGRLEHNVLVLVRISDNVLEEKDWGIDMLSIQFGIVVSQESLFKGVYEIPNMIGWTTNEVCEWTSYNEPEDHPQNFHELSHMEMGPVG